MMFTQRIWFILIILATLWITVNLFCIFFYKTHQVFGFINRFALPGPFFSEDRIIIVPHMLIKFKQGNQWGHWRNPEEENFLKYHDQLFRYHALAQSNLDRSLGRELSRRINRSGLENVLNYKEFETLKRYILQEYADSLSDSVQLMYIIDTFIPEKNEVIPDTAFLIAFKLNDK